MGQGYSGIVKSAEETPTLHVVHDISSAIYRSTAFNLSVYATDGNGNLLDVSGVSVTLTLQEGGVTDPDDKLYAQSGGAELTSVTLTNGVWNSSTPVIADGGDDDSDTRIQATASGYTTGNSTTFTVQGIASIYMAALSGWAYLVTDGTYVYALPRNSKIYRFPVNPFTYLDSLDLDDAAYEYHTLEWPVVHGTSMFVRGSRDPGGMGTLYDSLATINLTTFAYVSHDQDTDSDDAVGGIVADDTYIYTDKGLTGPGANDNYLYQVARSDYSDNDAVQVGGSGYLVPYYVDATYVYCICSSTSPGSLRKISVSGMNDSDSAGYNWVDDACNMVSDGTYLYAGTSTGNLYKVDMSDLSVSASNESTTMATFDWVAIDTDNSKLYGIDLANGKITQYATSNLAEGNTLTEAGLFGGPYGTGCMLVTGGYLFVVDGTSRKISRAAVAMWD